MTTKEERFLHELEGQTNPFRVPENYFESFEARLAERMPQTEPKRIVRFMPHLLRYAAAMLVMVGVSSALYWYHYEPKDIGLAEETSQEEYYNEELDYIMVDNMEIAEYLTEADY
ncbi:MAG: hypothetical protein IJ064_04700 [Bacteroidaceae bacterium]|nr:hypothetical protein [Bacteroidaceae bacterium]